MLPQDQSGGVHITALPRMFRDDRVTGILPPAVLAAGDAVAGGGVAAIGVLHDAYARAVVDNGLPIGGKLSRVVVTAEGANFAAVGDLG